MGKKFLSDELIVIAAALSSDITNDYITDHVIF